MLPSSVTCEGLLYGAAYREYGSQSPQREAQAELRLVLDYTIESEKLIILP